ncbi:MAG: hypothetical protein EOP87_23410, partial [Verrucomicrobiaceae bacterium]
MVANVATDLGGMATLAGAKPGETKTIPGSKEREYKVGSVAITMSPSCWDTASYKPLLEAWKPVAGASTSIAGPDLLDDLLKPTVKALQQANEQVSARISKAPGDAAVHEEAAFVLGVFGIRENARRFDDVRPLVCRMTAHLAMAEYLRGGSKPSLTGEWAQVLFDLHAGRPIRARELAAAIPQEGNSGRWKRAVDLLVTGDWRRTADLTEPSMVEMIAHIRALKSHRGNPVMLEFVGQEKELQAVPEWSRLLGSPGRSVEEGHVAMSSGIVMEFLEIGEIFPTGKEPKPERLAKYLSTPTTNTLVADSGPRVIQDGDWAAYFRRHFFANATNVSRFIMRQWDSPDDAVAWEEQILPYCRVLPGHELVEPWIATDVDDFQKDMKAAYAYTQA